MPYPPAISPKLLKYLRIGFISTFSIFCSTMAFLFFAAPFIGGAKSHPTYKPKTFESLPELFPGPEMWVFSAALALGAMLCLIKINNGRANPLELKQSGTILLWLSIFALGYFGLSLLQIPWVEKHGPWGNNYSWRSYVAQTPAKDLLFLNLILQLFPMTWLYFINRKLNFSKQFNLAFWVWLGVGLLAFVATLYFYETHNSPGVNRG